MSGEHRVRESGASIVIVPTTSSYELEQPERERAPHKRELLCL